MGKHPIVCSQHFIMVPIWFLIMNLVFEKWGKFKKRVCFGLLLDPQHQVLKNSFENIVLQNILYCGAAASKMSQNLAGSHGFQKYCFPQHPDTAISVITQLRSYQK